MISDKDWEILKVRISKLGIDESDIKWAWGDLGLYVRNASNESDWKCELRRLLKDTGSKKDPKTVERYERVAFMFPQHKRFSKIHFDIYQGVCEDIEYSQAMNKTPRFSFDSIKVDMSAEEKRVILGRQPSRRKREICSAHLSTAISNLNQALRDFDYRDENINQYLEIIEKRLQEFDIKINDRLRLAA
jgi:hypothetical protein